jgi:SP family xylose:H+ symportor-like MFS transporter
MNLTAETFNNRYIIGISFISALGGYLFGFDFAVIGGALPFLKTEFALTSVMEGFLTGTLALGCIVGCLIAGGGRKVWPPGTNIGGGHFRYFIYRHSAIKGARLLPGDAFCCRYWRGYGVHALPYVHCRSFAGSSAGRNVAINQLTVVLGILFTNLINYFLQIWVADAWRWMFGLGTVPSLIFLLGVLWLPESPRWLVKAGQNEKAQERTG